MILRDRQRVQSSWAEYSTQSLADNDTLRILEQVHVSESHRPIATWGCKSLEERLNVLQEAFRNKATKLVDYKNHVEADEFWLLVVSGPGLGCIPAVLASQPRYDDGFQRVYLMDEYGQDCFLLNSEQ